MRCHAMRWDAMQKPRVASKATEETGKWLLASVRRVDVKRRTGKTQHTRLQMNRRQKDEKQDQAKTRRHGDVTV